jgi:hypothetical protein
MFGLNKCRGAGKKLGIQKTDLSSARARRELANKLANVVVVDRSSGIAASAASRVFCAD